MGNNSSRSEERSRNNFIYSTGDSGISVPFCIIRWLLVSSKITRNRAIACGRTDLLREFLGVREYRRCPANTGNETRQRYRTPCCDFKRCYHASRSTNFITTGNNSLPCPPFFISSFIRKRFSLSVHCTLQQATSPSANGPK